MANQPESRLKAPKITGSTDSKAESAGKSGPKVLMMRTLRAVSDMVNRAQLANLAGLQFGGERDLYQVFGYKTRLTVDDFLAKYIRQDIVSRIIDAPPGATFVNTPRFDSEGGSEELHTQWNELNKDVLLWNAMYRADRLCRLNYFSLLLLGFDDSSDLSKPVKKGTRKLLYVRPMGSRLVDEVVLDKDERSPRYGKPEMYKIKFIEPDKKTITRHTTSVDRHKELQVHWSRVVHIVENPLEDDILGIPIMERIYNLLDDLLKVAGGTSEVYWIAGRQGLHLDIDKDMDFADEDTEALSEEVDEYMHQLRRVLRTRGVKAKNLGADPPKPKETFDMLMALISGASRIPRRILLGSEVGELASQQDRANWSDFIKERRILHVEPTILQPTLSRLQTYRVLPEGSPVFEWPDAFILNPLEEGQMMAQKARAVGNLSRQTGNKFPMQITSREEAREMLQLEGDLAESEVVEPPEEAAAGGSGGDGAPGARRPPTEEQPVPETEE